MAFKQSEVDNFFRGVGETMNVNQFELADDFESAWKDMFKYDSDSNKETPEVILAREILQLRKKVAELSKEASEAQETIMKYEFLERIIISDRVRGILDIMAVRGRAFRKSCQNFIIMYSYKKNQWEIGKHLNVAQTPFYFRSDREATETCNILNSKYKTGW